jgi:hypothetical protein
VDDEPLEERLIPLAAQVPRRGQVGAPAVGQQVERLAQRVLGVGEGSLGDFDVVLGLSGLGREPVLLGGVGPIADNNIRSVFYPVELKDGLAGHPGVTAMSVLPSHGPPETLRSR